LLFFVNNLLHFVGWVIVVELDENGKIADTYPAQTKFRGFTENAIRDGFGKFTNYLKGNIDMVSEDLGNE
jgi:hypothetical protein